MPCVHLANTFSRRRSLKAQKLARRKSGVETECAVLSENQIVKVPHARQSFSTSKHASRHHELEQLIEQYQLSDQFPAQAASLVSTSQDQPEVNLFHSGVRLTRADLINAESRLGSTIFGPIPAGHRREFFHDQNNIWIWHEDWYDGQNNPHQLTVRYEVRTSGIYKKIAAGKYFKLEGDELENFRRATHAYLHVVKQNLYNQQARFATTN